ncbi:MAG: hypothetical protein QMD71_09860 [bacterium]|nr:hypothetical protein [bacterium]
MVDRKKYMSQGERQNHKYGLCPLHVIAQPKGCGYIFFPKCNKIYARYYKTCPDDRSGMEMRLKDRGDVERISTKNDILS